jgi:glucose/arabinose dehydrogenase
MNTKIYLPTGRRLSIAFILLYFLFGTNKILAQPVLSLSPVIDTGLSSPIQFVHAGDGTNRVFIVQQGGDIRVYDGSFNYLDKFLTVSNVNFSGERGLLSMAFHPDYATNGFFFVYYVNGSGSLELARYQVSSDANVADETSKVILITIPHPRYANHNGGELHFGNDGYLYLSTGDGGGAGDVSNNAQNTAVLLGKMLRFNVNTSATAPFYTIPPGNPYSNEIYDLGLRNPYRWSFDRQTYDMWIGDVGQDSYEEINFRAAASTAGVNYGWRCYEGNATYNTSGCGAIAGYVFPAFNYPSQNPSAAITGGIVYRGTQYPVLQGYNISADFYSGIFYLTSPDGSGGWNTIQQTLSPTGMVDFGETEDGEGYVVSLLSNAVYRITATGTVAVSMSSFNGSVAAAGVNLSWKTASEQSFREFQVEYSTNGASFDRVGTVLAKNSALGSTYSFLHRVSYEGGVYYRLKMVNVDGSSRYSDVVHLFLKGNGRWVVVPSLINNGTMNVNLAGSAYQSLELISLGGAVLLQKNLLGQSGQVKVAVGKFPAGVYMVRLTGRAGAALQKVVIQ